MSDDFDFGGVAPAEAKNQPKPVEDAFGHPTACKLAFIGAGQAGGNLADTFYQLGYRRVAVYNTTDQDAAGVDKAIPRVVASAGGAHKDPAYAAQVLQSHRDDVWDLLARSWGSDVDCAVVCAGLGGGTGSGSVVPLVELAREYLYRHGQTQRVGALVSLPTHSEGPQAFRNCVETFRNLLAIKPSPLIVIDNARINELFKPSMKELFPTANQRIAKLFHAFNRLAAQQSQSITFDRSEFIQLLDSGLVAMGSAIFDPATIASPADISTKIREQLGKSILASVELRKGKKGVCVFLASPEVMTNFSLDYFEAGFDQVGRLLGAAHKSRDGVVLHRGLYELGKSLQCCVMIGELEPPLQRFAEMAVAAGMPLNTKTIADYLQPGKDS